ncbi:LacI family DNA-binding transcriptional regulator [Anaerocolumna sp. MB42-C2]|uniref:LacI family DNA-binding transcriptional regulator n=1 Tax=Anaerocolumna sp. MB42-C2 TaxID=3070997 RepID=UPI0027DF3BD8|nr:LacI family DNA-binding transcriptional regulator [Anaerocolumna sp. MB42-C2]WMJ90414.1 LacI family DNA-binding transcriptional regulator [Anaerocolumna sp. MB42-C2]
MATLSDIANVCGVSKATVSRILNNDPDFSVTVQTREQVLSTAAAMNYDIKIKKRTPNNGKRNNPKGKSNVSSVLKVGVLSFSLNFSDKNDDYYSKILNSCTAFLNEAPLSYKLEFHYIVEDSYEALSGMDALIILGKLHLDPYHPIIANIKYKLIIDYAAPDKQFDSVQVNFYEVIKMAAEYFHSLKITDIGFIGSYDYITQFNQQKREKALDSRHLAFRDYCLQNDIDPSKKMWIGDYFSSEEGYRITTQLIQKNVLPSAILFASDEMALGSYKSFQEHNIQIGKDISIIGIDNIPYTSFLNPSLSTISLNIPTIGETAGFALLSQIQGRKFPLVLHTPIQLIKRNSCKQQ